MSERALRVYDRPMCCSTGVCGPDVDPELVRFAADLDWLGRQGVRVERYNPSQEPGAFVGNPAVRRALQEKGNDSLPLVLWGEATVSSGRYPDRDTLTQVVGLPTSPASASGRSA
jgi:hypothetical protein